MQTKTKLKISDFSNIFSPKNKANRERSLTNRSPRFNYTLSPAPIRTPRAPSQNLSASSHNKLMLSELEQIDQIRKINQLAPSKDKVAMIN